MKLCRKPILLAGMVALLARSVASACSKSLNGEEQRLEYETLFALGPLCGIKEPEAVLQAARLCDKYGMDTISTGGTLAWAMECGEKGLLPEAESFGLRFGRPEGILSRHPHYRRATGARGAY